MRVAHKKISSAWISQLSDWEIISAFSYCSKVLRKENIIYEEEFLDICFFFFDDNENLTKTMLENIKNMYIKEYSKRRLN